MLALPGGSVVNFAANLRWVPPPPPPIFDFKELAGQLRASAVLSRFYEQNLENKRVTAQTRRGTPLGMIIAPTRSRPADTVAIPSSVVKEIRHSYLW